MSDAASPAGVRLAAIRGAIDVPADSPEVIQRAVQELVRRISERNQLRAEDVVSAQFTMTPDLRSVFPAAAARVWGWLGCEFARCIQGFQNGSSCTSAPRHFSRRRRLSARSLASRTASFWCA